MNTKAKILTINTNHGKLVKIDTTHKSQLRI